MRHPHLVLPGVLLLLVLPGFGGCLTDFGTTGGEAGPGHAATATLSRADSARLTGLALARDFPQGATFQVANPSIADGPALTLGSVVLADGSEGTLVALGPSVSLQGPLAATVGAVSARDGRLSHEIARGDGASPFVPAAAHEAGLHDEMFFTTPLALRATGPFEVAAERIVLVTEASVRNLSSPARVTGADQWVATGPLTTAAPSARDTFTVTAARGLLAVSNATGEVRVDEGAVHVPVNGPAILSVGRGTRVTLDASAGRVDAAASGSVYQVFAAGKGWLPAKLEGSFSAASVTVGANASRGVRLSLRNLDANADVVVTAIRLEGAPGGAVHVPKVEPYRPLIEQLAQDPASAFVATMAAPALIVAEFFIAVADALFGPPGIPQVLEAAAAFDTEVTVTGTGSPFAFTLVIEGNFPTLRIPLEVVPAGA